MEELASAIGSLAGGRYVLRRLLGTGGMGRVYAAFDSELGREVALKMLHGRSADDLYRLKYEFRTLADLHHPNLVTLHELVVDAACPFFTMELLSAVDLVSYVRAESTGKRGRPGAGGWERARAVLPQLLAGLQALHAAGRLHRDVKPRNVLVTEQGQVLLIDFGIATLPTIASPWSEPELAGTLAYIAPELVRGEPPSVASDFYALGVTLFESLTGELPPGPRTVRDLEDRVIAAAAPAVGERVPDTPADLAALVAALLRPDPRERPDHDGVAGLVRADEIPMAALASPLVPSTAALWQAPFVDRAESLAALEAALRDVDGGRAVIVRIEGPSGIGKSALVRHFLAQLPKPHTLVLAGRCYPQETVPFKALDALVDALSEWLDALPAVLLDDLSPDAVTALLRLFPVLRRVPALAALATPEAPGSELEEIRRTAFATLRELLRRISEQERLVLWIDDLQWGDADSAVFLRMLAHPREAPALLVLLSYRSGAEAASVAEFLRDEDGRPIGRILTVEPLPEDDARALASNVLALPHRPPALSVDEIVRESHGNPFLVCEIARYCAAYGERPAPLASERGAADATESQRVRLGIHKIVASRLHYLNPDTRRLLAAVAVAGGPCRGQVLSRAADLEHGFGESLTALRNECLLRDSARGSDVFLETFHDRIREAVVDLLDAEERRGIHLALADALAREADVDPLELVQHYHAGGEDARAARTAVLAAERAYGALAFDQAARLYEFALEVGTDGTDRWRLVRGRADALAQAGRGGDAGAAYREAIH